jgi:hypothetical protein
MSTSLGRPPTGKHAVTGSVWPETKPYCFSVFLPYQTPQHAPDLFMDSNYILHVFIDFAKEDVILIFAKYQLGKQDS